MTSRCQPSPRIAVLSRGPPVAPHVCAVSRLSGDLALSSHSCQPTQRWANSDGAVLGGVWVVVGKDGYAVLNHAVVTAMTVRVNVNHCDAMRPIRCA